MRARDFDASVRFYTEALGFRATLAWGEGDGRAVMLDAGDGSCIEIFAGGSGEDVPEGRLLHFALRAADVDAAVERAVAGGAEVTVAPQHVDIPTDPVTPVRLAFCKGPNGEVIEFFCEHQTKKG